MIKEQIEEISKALNACFAATDITKKEISDRTGLAIGTVNNCFKAPNFNISSFLSVLDAMGMNIKDFIDWMSANEYEFPTSTYTVQSLNTTTIKNMVDAGGNVDQLSMRAGIDNLSDALNLESEECTVSEDDDFEF